MRSSVDLPQPEGPRMVMKSLLPTARSVGSSALVGALPWRAGEGARDLLDLQRGHASLHGNSQRVERLEQEVREQADQPDDDDAEDDLAGIQQRLAVDDHVADAGGRADQLGDDDVGPGPAEHQPQDLGDLGRGGGQQHAADDAAVAGAQRIGGLDQVAPRRADRDRDHQDDLEHRADEDDQQLLQFADAGPQDQQRNEGRGRQIAGEGDEGFEEGLDRLVGAHQHAERHRDDRGQRKAADDAPDGHADVEQEAVLGQQLTALLHHGQRIGEEGRSTRGRRSVAQDQRATNSTKKARP